MMISMTVGPQCLHWLHELLIHLQLTALKNAQVVGRPLTDRHMTEILHCKRRLFFIAAEVSLYHRHLNEAFPKN